MGSSDVLVTKDSSESLHYRTRRQHDARTPDAISRRESQEHMPQLSSKEKNVGTNGLNGASKLSQSQNDYLAPNSIKKDHNEHSSAGSDDGSDEDDDLLPSFTADSGKGDALAARYSNNVSEAAGSSSSLGLHQNGFISRDDLNPRTSLHREDSGLSNNADTNEKVSNNKKRPRRRKRKDWERYRTRQFAKEMVFVTVPSILLSMLGSVLAGEVLAQLKTWPVFLRVEELFILVPILLNLKGNLEMNLAARFSTSANIGELDLRQTRRSLVLGNMALLQVQALLVSLLAGIVAFVLGLMSRQGLANSPAVLTGNDISIYGIERGGYFESMMVICASMIAASASSAVVGAFMCALVVVSRFLRINPDNLATPLAASLGDLLALTILGVVAKVGASFVGTFWNTIIFVCLLAFIGANIFFTMRNAYVQELVWAGWIPLLLALGVSSATGVVLQVYVNEYRGFGLIAPVVTGVAGNVGAIFVSRISTALHGAKEERYLLTATTLFGITTPILIAFLAFVWVTEQAKIGLAFAITYSIMSVLLMGVSLSCAYGLTFWLWRRDFDPDINALPLLSSAVDLFGQLLLVGAYAMASAFGGDVILPDPVIQSDGSVILNGTIAATEHLLRRTITSTKLF